MFKFVLSNSKLTDESCLDPIIADDGINKRHSRFLPLLASINGVYEFLYALERIVLHTKPEANPSCKLKMLIKSENV